MRGKRTDRESLRHAVESAHRSRRAVQCVGFGHDRDRSRLALHPPSGILDFWPDELVVRVGAATSFAALDDFLAPWGFESGVGVGRPHERSLGGAYARGAGGRTGESLRERVLSALVVDGRGTPLELGARVVKNVAGYDLLRLHFGAGGSLGAISDLLLRVRARPASRASRLLHVEPEACIDALMSVRRAAPSASSCEFYLSEGLLSLWGERGRGAWLCFEEGAAAGVRAWEEAVGGEGCSRGPVELDEIGLESDPDGCTLEFYLSARAALERHHDLDRCCRWWWLDAGRGILRASVPSSRQRELRRSLPGPAYLVAGRLDHEASATNATVDTWMRRLRRAFDPAEIFPPAPRPLP